MNGLEITKELKNDIEVNQIQLQNAIRNHQNLMVKLKSETDEKTQYLKEIKQVEEKIVQIGYEQKKLLDRLREEYKAHQKSLKQNTIKASIEERRFNLTNALNRARKQNLLPRTRSSPINSLSDDSDQRRSPQLPTDDRPTHPNDISQSSFLAYFRLATHEVYGEMQKKRAERKRRSTANPQFVYGNKGWDWGPPTKRKRNHFLAHPPSPPNTRGRKRQEMARSKSKSPPSSQNNSTHEKLTNGNQSSQKNDIKSSFPSIPNLPSGLIIERVSPGRSSPDAKQCIMCKQPGALSICEQCTNGFHISCHNRPFARTPKECPKCLLKESRRSGSASHNNTSGSTAVCQSIDLTEKLKLKQELEEKHQNLIAELTQLQNRHSELTISLKNQESEKEQLRSSHQATETKVNQIIKFIETVKSIPVQEKSNS